MAIEPGRTASAQTPTDPRKLRHPLEKDDLALNPAGQALLQAIDESYRPNTLAAQFPRIVNRMAKVWKTPLQMDRCFEELLTDTRGGRQGFPLGVLMELSTLKDYYHTKVFPTRRDAFSDRPQGRA